VASVTAAPAASPPDPPKASYAYDGVYRGRACWQQPGSEKAPACWTLELTVAQHRIDSSWVGQYGKGKSSSIRGQISPRGGLVAQMEGFRPGGKSVMGDLEGRADEGRLTFTGMLDNGVRITGSATRVR
jgi:hypothetical protein